MRMNRIAYGIALALLPVGLITYFRDALGIPFLSTILAIAVIGFFLALMDSSIGMGFGTIGSPLLVLLGYSSKIVVPSVLIAQASGAIFAVALHHRYKHVNFTHFNTDDSRILKRLIVFGLLGTIIAALIAVNLNKFYLNLYIGVLVVIMGSLLVIRPKFSFSWLKVNILSFVSGFNKAISGGGYGPVATTGLLVSGNPLKNSVGVTLFSVFFINLSAFTIYLLSHTLTSLTLPLFLTVGAAIGAQFGPRVTKRLHGGRSLKAFAILAIVLGVLTVILTFVK